MKLVIQRLIAILLLVVPGLMATYGFVTMKDAWFNQFGAANNDPHIQWGKLALGLALFAAGVAFIGGWTFYRDRRRNYVAPRFRQKKEKKR